MSSKKIRTPRVYKIAAHVVDAIIEKKGSLKKLIANVKHPNKKGIYALVLKLFQKKNAVDELLKKSELLKDDTRTNKTLAKILITELLWGKKKIMGENRLIQSIRTHEQIFKAHLSEICHSDEDIPKDTNLAFRRPRYARINTLKTSAKNIIECLKNEGWNYLKLPKDANYKQFLEHIQSLNENDFTHDFHVNDLLIFHHSAKLFDHEMCKEGQLILQDKACCLPVHILMPPPGSTVLDLCAAPGNKTTHMASVMDNKGKIFAIERNEERCKILNESLKKANCNCVTVINEDALRISRKECPNVEYILVDPSCSGSGLHSRINVEKHAAKNEELRLKKLAGFQIKLLRHALTRFPKAKKVIYSTCSLNPVENEDVVRQVIESCYKFKLVKYKKYLNDTWINHGSSEFGKIGKYCLYAKPEVDQTVGFFVAIFERLEENEVNQFYREDAFKTFQETRSAELLESNNIQQSKDAPIENKKHKRTFSEVEERETQNGENYTKVNKKPKKSLEVDGKERQKNEKSSQVNKKHKVSEDDETETKNKENSLKQNKNKKTLLKVDEKGTQNGEYSFKPNKKHKKAFSEAEQEIQNSKDSPKPNKKHKKTLSEIDHREIQKSEYAPNKLNKKCKQTFSEVIEKDLQKNEDSPQENKKKKHKITFLEDTQKDESALKVDKKSKKAFSEVDEQTLSIDKKDLQENLVKSKEVNENILGKKESKRIKKHKKKNNIIETST